MPKSTPKTAAFDIFHNHRFTQLDGLRGIASVTVGLNHAIGSVVALTGAGGVFLAAAAGIVNGALAVDLFFIMSGFFLAGMMRNLTTARWPRFYLRRLARLAPPAMVSVVILFIYAKLFIPGQTTTGASTIFKAYVADNLTIRAREFLLNFGLVHHTLNPVLWTIRIEIVSSLLFPPLYMLKNFYRLWFYKISIYGALLFIAIILRHHQTGGLDVLHYLYIFYAGALARDFGPWLASWPAGRTTALFALAMGLTLYFAYVVPTNGVHPIAFDLPVTVFGTGAVALLAYGHMARIKTFMNSTIVQFLGRISYSYYLVNFLFVQALGGLALTYGLPNRLGPSNAILFIAAISTLLSLPFGYLFHLIFERPAVALSRHVGRVPA